MKKILLSAAMIFIACWAWSQTVNVTFQVDMTNVTGFTTANVNGTFNGWCGACNPLTDSNTDGVWEVTIPLTATDTFEYKFTYDGWTGQENLTSGTSCTVTNFGFTNRQLITGTSDVTLPVVCWQSCNSCAAPPRAVTFRVDLSNINGFTTPTVNGIFNGWSGTANPLSDTDADGIWEAVVYLPDGTYEYKFAYDNWTGEETLIPGSSCTVTNSGYTNRRIVVSADAVLPVVCWNSCSTCAAALLPKNVTFKVDMQNVTGFTTANVNGSFNGWCGSCNPLTDANSDGIWETTIQLNQDTFEYKFTYDGWTGQENLTPGSSCTSTLGGYTNRTIIVGNADQVLPVVCWESCASCAPPTRNITFKVDMSTVAGFNPATDVPCVNGTFENWSGGTYPMTDANSDGVWERTIALADGSYEYKFAYNAWSASESLVAGSSCTVTNGGYTNRSLTVNGVAQTLNTVCWASCNSCAAPTYNVTFQINMNNESNFTTPYISGSFNGWCGNCNPMTDANNDGIWQVTLPLQQGTYEYKVSVDDWAGSEQLIAGSSCTVTNFGYTNRSLVVGTTAQTLPVACYGTCIDCVTLVAVTFQVNLEQISGYTTPTVNGQFNGWSGTANPLTDANNDDIYTTTIYLSPGTYEFKYAADDWAMSETLIPGLPCTVTNFGFTNRQVVITGDTILPVACWASCGACINNYNVTFQVDMTNATGFTTPEVNGDFNGWCGGCFPLSDPDGNGIWTGTATIQQGPHEFKFAHDGWAGQESLTEGSSCTTTNFGYTNRLVNVQSNITLPVVCYGQCSGCSYAVSNDSPYNASNVVYSSNMVYPNCFTIQGNTSSASDSPQSAAFTGKDVWYKFTAISSGVSVTLTSSAQDDAIAIYSRSGSSFNLLSGASENASSSASDFERLNYSGLTPGQTYYVCAGSASGAGGAFSMCLQHLAQSGCSYTSPVGGYNLCNTFKSTYRGSSSQGVSYTFNFAGVGGGATGTTTASGANLVTLSNPALGLRYGGVYDVQVDVNYALQDGSGTTENVLVAGNGSSTNCNDVTIMAQPLVEVRSDQRCPASLYRGAYLNGARIGTASLCGALNYTYEFTQVTSCSNSTVVSVAPALYTNTGSAPYLRLTVLPNLGNTGAWDVRIRPNFSYGEGTFGPAQRIQVIGTSASGEVLYEVVDAEKEAEVEAADFTVYPNPNTGNAIQVQATNLQSEQVSLRVLDAMGRIVYSRGFMVNGSLMTSIAFDQALSTGVYTMEITDNDQVKTERLVIQN